MRHSLRLLRRAPGFAIAVIVILGLGIGANSALFTALDRTMNRPLPYANPDGLVMLWEDFSVCMANCQIGLNAVVFEALIPLPGCATSLSYSFI